MKQIQIEDIFAISAVELLDVSVLRRLPGLDEVQKNIMFLSPLHQGSGDELRSVIDANPLWIASPVCHPLQDAYDPLTGQGCVDLNRQRFPVEVVDEVQRPKALSSQ